MPSRQHESTGFSRSSSRGIGLLLTGLGIGLLVGSQLTGGISTADARQPRRSPYRKLAVFARVLSYIETEYVDPVNRDQAIEDAIRGLLRRLDPHTQFYTAKQVRLLRSALTGRYSGVGLTVSRRAGRVLVLNAAPGGPAGRAGIRPGDTLEAINGVSVAHQDLATITTHLQGRRGTRVALTVRARGQKRARAYRLVRDTLRRMDVLKAALPNGLGYLSVRRFSNGVARAARRAIAELQRAQGGHLKGLVLDLRDNPGGLMDEGIRLADQFVHKGLILRKVGKRGRLKEREFAHLKGTIRGLPLVVLINRGTASAAEIVAGCLADHKRARLVGERSFGKGSMQSIIPLPDGSRLKLTIARYFRPSGAAIDGIGIAPDIRLRAATRTTPVPPANALTPPKRAVKPPLVIPAWVQRDPVLKRALVAVRRFRTGG